MLRFIITVIKAAFLFALKVAALPFELMLASIGGRRVAPPPPVPLPEPPEEAVDDPDRRIAQEIRRWAIRRGRGTMYTPQVPDAVVAWLHTLDAERIRRLSQLGVDDIRRLLASGTESTVVQSISSRRASAAASARSARNARDRQYSAASIHSQPPR
jgi:hypothetical protein